MDEWDGLKAAYTTFFMALAWFPFSLIGNVASAILTVAHAGTGAVQVEALWKQWTSTALTLLVTFAAMLLTQAMGDLNMTSAILLGLAGDKALNKWQIKGG